MGCTICSARALAKLIGLKHIDTYHTFEYTTTPPQAFRILRLYPWPSTSRGCSRDANNGTVNSSGGTHHGGWNGEGHRQADTCLPHDCPAHRSFVSTSLRPPGSNLQDEAGAMAAKGDEGSIVKGQEVVEGT